MNLRCFALRTDIAGTILVLMGCFSSYSVLPCLGQEVNKRGLGAGDNLLINSVNASWGYDWSIAIDSGRINGEFVPMAWSGSNASNWNNRFNQIDSSGSKYVLGFNEPELPGQANMTVANAVTQWGNLSDRYGTPDANGERAVTLVSPAVSDTGKAREWLADFMSGADDAGYVVDEIAFHFYSGSSATPASAARLFLQRVEEYHETYNKNIWVTEFGGIDYGNNFTADEMQVWNRDFLDRVLPELDSRDYVTRYAWWNHNNDTRLAVKNSYGTYRPTMVGDAYVGTQESGDTKDLDGLNAGLEMQYLRGGSLVNNGADMGNNAIGRLYALRDYDSLDDRSFVNTNEVVSNFGGSGDWGFHSWGSLSIDEHARLRKQGTGTVTLRDIDIYNDGELQIQGGAANSGGLAISGAGTRFYGDGKITLNASTLKLGDSADSAGFELPYDIDYRGGNLLVAGPDIEITGDGNVITAASFTADNDFIISGDLTGTGNVFKRGDATLFLEGDQSYTGTTNVMAGTLSVNGILRGGNVLVASNGELGGNGEVLSSTIVNAGGIVDPGNSTGVLTLADASFAAGSTLRIELLSITDFDQLLLSGELDVSPDALLEIALLDGYQPEIGDSFDILNFGSLAGDFQTFSAPTLLNGAWDYSLLATTGTLRVVATAVPEPSSFALLSILWSTTLLARRRRHSSC